MSRSRPLIGIITTGMLLAAFGVAVAPAARAHAAGHTETFTVVADHLNNPRGLSPAPHGGLYLAEAGAGGDVCVAAGPGGETCIRLTGAFGWVRTGIVRRRLRRRGSGRRDLHRADGVVRLGQHRHRAAHRRWAGLGVGSGWSRG